MPGPKGGLFQKSVSPVQWKAETCSLFSFFLFSFSFSRNAAVDNIFQLDVLKTMWQIKGYDGMLQAIKASTVRKIPKTKIFINDEDFIEESNVKIFSLRILVK